MIDPHSRSQRMSISEPFIRRPIATSLLAIGLMLAGAVAYRSLPVAPLPQVDFPTINVQANYPGVDPATAATSLAAPLERRFANIAGVNEITSVSQLRFSLICLEISMPPRATSRLRLMQPKMSFRPDCRTPRAIARRIRTICRY
jgi:multidrug efflux pump